MEWTGAACCAMRMHYTSARAQDCACFNTQRRRDFGLGYGNRIALRTSPSAGNWIRMHPGLANWVRTWINWADMAVHAVIHSCPPPGYVYTNNIDIYIDVIGGALISGSEKLASMLVLMDIAIS